MNLTLESTVTAAGPQIVIEASSVFDGKRDVLYRQMIQTQDAQITARLIDMGWTPPNHPIAKLARYGLKVLVAARTDGGCDIDGGTLQEYGEETGVLERREVLEPCGDACVCAAYAGFPTDCFFVPEDVLALMKD